MSKTFPAILRAKDGGALLLEGARSDPMKGSVVIIRDPAAPETELVAVEEIQLAEFWEGELILIKRIFAATDDQQPFGMAWLAGQVLREGKLFRDIGIGAMVSTIFTIAPPFMFMIVIDRVLVNNSYPTLNVLVGAVLIMIVTETILGHVRRILTQVVSTRIDGRLNLYIVEKLLKLPLNFFEINPAGRTLNKLHNIWQVRIFSDGSTIRDISGRHTVVRTHSGDADPRMAPRAHGVCACRHHFRDRDDFLAAYFPRTSRVVVAEQAKTAHLVETLHGMRTIKSLSLEGRRRKEWDVLVAEATAARHRLGLVSNWPQTLSRAAAALDLFRLFRLWRVHDPWVAGHDPRSTRHYVERSHYSHRGGYYPDPGALVAFAILSMRLAAAADQYRDASAWISPKFADRYFNSPLS